MGGEVVAVKQALKGTGSKLLVALRDRVHCPSHRCTPSIVLSCAVALILSVSSTSTSHVPLLTRVRGRLPGDEGGRSPAPPRDPSHTHPAQPLPARPAPKGRLAESDLMQRDAEASQLPSHTLASAPAPPPPAPHPPAPPANHHQPHAASLSTLQ